MTHDEFTAVLGSWEGYRVVGCQRLEADPQKGRKRPVVEIQREPDPGRIKRCDGCGEEVSGVHDVAVRRIRDLPILDLRGRVACEWPAHAAIVTRLIT